MLVVGMRFRFNRQYIRITFRSDWLSSNLATGNVHRQRLSR